MGTPSVVFDTHIDQWRKEQTFPWTQLKHKLCHANITKHLDLAQPLRILDAGGGTGVESVPFAEQGHLVDLVDYSVEMISDARLAITERGLEDRVRVHLADVSQLSSLFSPASFDLILCHNVLQYVADVPDLIRQLGALLKPNGLLSLASINRFARSLSAAFLHNDLEKAHGYIEQRTFPTLIFKAPMTVFSAEEMCEITSAQGLHVLHDYGVLCIFSYWGDNERKNDPTILAQLEHLEFAMTDKHPYKLMASYYQILARK